MALRQGVLQISGCEKVCSLMRWVHSATAMPAPLDGSLHRPTIASPPLVLPPSADNNTGSFEFGLPGFGSGSMELMAVPKKKVSRHKRGIRNGPKALKPTPVIIRCKSCGRVKLPHFYCCSGNRENTGEQNN